ncbi:N-acetylglutaminylglutamine amidotransferase, partial [Rhodococcus hoagii]|nr:N-acetylglutaminylglutamine amidotransferase [Prescottella equi]
MSDAMVTRGPDTSGAYAQQSVAFGHRRLCIIDLSARGGQPMVDSELRLSLVFNGCIYNYKSCARSSVRPGTVLLGRGQRGGAQELPSLGPDCVHRFKGMFAFAVHEIDSGVVTFARDRLGIKPLYFAQTPERFAVRLDVAGAVARRRRGHDDRSCALHHYLSSRRPSAPLTMFEGV